MCMTPLPWAIFPQACAYAHEIQRKRLDSAMAASSTLSQLANKLFSRIDTASLPVRAKVHAIVLERLLANSVSFTGYVQSLYYRP